jgi:adenylate cyclase
LSHQVEVRDLSRSHVEALGQWLDQAITEGSWANPEPIEALLDLAEETGNAFLGFLAHNAAGRYWENRGDFAQALDHANQALAHYDADRHAFAAFHQAFDRSVGSLGTKAWSLHRLGYLDQARRWRREAIAKARELSHPNSLTFTLMWLAWEHVFEGEVEAALSLADEVIARATEYESPHLLGSGTAIRCWALVESGRVEEGLAAWQDHLAVHGPVLGNTRRPCPVSLILNILMYRRAGLVEQGLRVVEEAFAALNETWPLSVDRISYLCLQGELLQDMGEGDAAVEACFQKALQLAREMQTKALELQAATSLARLWQRQGRRAAAHRLLSEVYDWFTEGFDTKDLREARALLGELEETKDE